MKTLYCLILFLLSSVKECQGDEFWGFKRLVLRSDCFSPTAVVDSLDHILFYAVVKRDTNVFQKGSYFTLESLEMIDGREFKTKIGSVSMFCTGFSSSLGGTLSEGSCTNSGTVLFLYIKHLASREREQTRYVGTWIQDNLSTEAEPTETKVMAYINATKLHTLDSVEVSVTINDEENIGNDELFNFDGIKELSIYFCVKGMSYPKLTLYLGQMALEFKKINKYCVLTQLTTKMNLAGQQLFFVAQEFTGLCRRQLTRKITLVSSPSINFSTSTSTSILIQYTNSIEVSLLFVLLKRLTSY
ncbi:hypothetical protein BgiBS90_022541 [Biomphalaria glabrata]|nr:hypothetical protein BgiBS90_022541 [Biomphalaria glabrata]